jgi:hypothetical protein
MSPTGTWYARLPPMDEERTVAASNSARIDALLQSAATTVEQIVTAAMHRGLSVGELAVVVERRVDGQVLCACALRHDLVRLVPSYGPPADEVRLAADLEAATADELLIVLFVHRGEGVVHIGVRKERGELVAVM